MRSSTGVCPAIASATNRPLTGPSRRPLAPWPVATCTFGASGGKVAKGELRADIRRRLAEER